MPLYDVPQTDSTTEPAMAALVARLRASAPKPEAITPGAATDATLALLLARWVDRVGASLGDRATLPLVQWDSSLDGACIALASRDWYNTRGRNRQAGADEGIDSTADEALAYLSRLRSGDRAEQPRYVDSLSNDPQDRVLTSTQEASSSWTRDTGAGRRLAYRWPWL
jgi:hypothetical protein